MIGVMTYIVKITFPNGRHDDQVDAMTMAIHYMKESWNLVHPDDPDYEEGYERKKGCILEVLSI